MTSLKNLNNLIEKYEDKREFVDSIEARRKYGPFATSDRLLIIDEILRDLKEVRNKCKF